MLPDQFYKNIIPIANNGEFLHIGDVCLNLQKVTSDKIKWKKDTAQIAEGHMPLMIKSLYAVKGEAYTDISLYSLDTTIVVTDKEYEPPHITFDGLSFLKRFPNNEPVDLKFLNELGNSPTGYELVNSPTGFEVKPRAP
jgi:hypothetical protein